MRTITIARKPFTGTVAATALAFGTGGMNIAASRIPFAGEDDMWSPAKGASLIYKSYMDGSGQDYSKGHHEPSALEAKPHNSGRWPANVILTPEAATALDEQSGELRSAGHYPSESKGTGAGLFGQLPQGQLYADKGGASRYFKVIDPCE